MSQKFPNIDSAVAEIAKLSSELTLPMGALHISSDIHGEDRKLRHIINNASGTLRPLVERLLKARLPEKEFEELLTFMREWTEPNRASDSLRGAELRRSKA